jgi:hypothetical protein
MKKNRQLIYEKHTVIEHARTEKNVVGLQTMRIFSPKKLFNNDLNVDVADGGKKSSDCDSIKN